MEQDPWDEDPVDQLPAVIEPGSIQFTLWSSALGDDLVAYDISLKWDGQHTAEWFEDISIVNSLSPGSSAPVRGIASWPGGDDVLLSYTWFDLGKQGHDRLPGAAPTSGNPDGMKDPRGWVKLGEALLDFVLSDLSYGGETPAEYWAEYYDPAKDVSLDFHELFQEYLDSGDGSGALPDFDEWLESAVAAGTYKRLDDD